MTARKASTKGRREGGSQRQSGERPEPRVRSRVSPRLTRAEPVGRVPGRKQLTPTGKGVLGGAHRRDTALFNYVCAVGGKANDRPSDLSAAGTLDQTVKKNTLAEVLVRETP